MRSGQLRWRIGLQRFTSSRDGYGQETRTWSTLATYWGSIRTPTGREALNAAQQKAELTHVVTLRWTGESTTITPKDQLSYKGRLFAITWINNVDERNRQLDIYCQELVAPVGT